jgi:transmembrane sensor
MSSNTDKRSQAIAWLAKEDRGLDAAEAGALEQWLESDTANRVTYLRVKSYWRHADRLAALDSPRLDFAQTTLRRNRNWFVGAALAATVLVCAFVGGWYVVGPGSGGAAFEREYATAIGQQRTITLSDGSRFELNTNSRLNVSFTRTARSVTLDRGEAYFDVGHDKKRPLVVLVGNRRIFDIGTKFAVRRDGNRIEVVIEAGRVRVETPSVHGGVETIEAGAGSTIKGQADGLLLLQKSPTDIAGRLSWRRGILVFRDERLAAVADEFNRYNATRLVVTGNARDRLIGGRFIATNVRPFADLLKKGLGLHVKDNGSELVISE